MAKEQQESPEEYVMELFSRVLSRKTTMVAAEKLLRDCVSKMSEEEQLKFRSGARSLGLSIMQVSEAFLQQLTVIGAGQ